MTSHSRAHHRSHTQPFVHIDQHNRQISTPPYYAFAHAPTHRSAQRHAVTLILLYSPATRLTLLMHAPIQSRLDADSRTRTLSPIYQPHHLPHTAVTSRYGDEVATRATMRAATIRPPRSTTHPIPSHSAPPAYPCRLNRFAGDDTTLWTTHSLTTRARFNLCDTHSYSNI